MSVSNKDKDWSKVKYNELRGIASKLNKTKNANIPMGGSKDAIAEGVSKFYGGTGKFASAPTKAKKATPKARKMSKVVGEDINAKIEKQKATPAVKGVSSAQYNNIVDKLDRILNSIEKAMPSMNEKELNELSQLASTVKGTMQTMR